MQLTSPQWHRYRLQRCNAGRHHSLGRVIMAIQTDVSFSQNTVSERIFFPNSGFCTWWKLNQKSLFKFTVPLQKAVEKNAGRPHFMFKKTRQLNLDIFWHSFF
eukprot:EG_transcript_56112